MKKFIPIFIILIAFFIGIFFLPQLPLLVATHWGADGQANGYSTREFSIYFLPILMAGLYFLFLFLPSIDPYKKNFSQFKNHYDNFVAIIMFFLLYIHAITIYWNLGNYFNMIQVLSPAFAVLFYYAGILTENAHQNWFVGIRTPWTMSNKIVWQKTHILGGKLFKITGLIALFSLILPNFAIFLIIVPPLITATIVFVYSYFEYQKITK